MAMQFNRRRWMTASSAAVAASALSYGRIYGANERLGIASVGTGGKGWSDLSSVAASPAVQVVALCDVDHSREHLGRAAERFPIARRYADWRVLLDESKDIDAVIVATPDFMHAPIAIPCMAIGKHVYCEKPLTHTVYEARQMRLASERFGRVTQMGNQIQSHSAYRTAVSWVHQGLIGKISEVHSWQSSGSQWPRSPERPENSDAIPSHLHWDLWNGVAPERPFKAGVYHPFNWRGWRDFGTGMLGDFGCHILDPVFKAIELAAPQSLQAEAPTANPEVWVDHCVVRYFFPGNQHTARDQIAVTWYDGIDKLPDRQSLKFLPEDHPLPRAGSVLIGETGSLLIPHVAAPTLFPQERFANQDLPVVESVDHYVQWADACRGVGSTTSDFEYAGQLTETVLLGIVAQRLPGQKLEWDTSKLAFSNSPAANQMITKAYREGWKPDWT